MRALVLASGPSDTMHPLATMRHRCLLELHGKAIIDHVIEPLIRSRIPVVVVGEDDVCKHIIKAWSGEPLVSVVKQKEPGIEGAILTAESYISSEDRFLLVYGDVLLPEEGYRTLFNASLSEENIIFVAGYEGGDTYGHVDVGEDFYVKRIYPSSKSGLVFIGLAALSTKIVDELKAGKDILSALSSLPRLKAIVWGQEWIDVAYPWDLIRASQMLLGRVKSVKISCNAEVSPKAVIEGPVMVDEGAVIDHYAVIKGPAYIGKKAFIGAYSFIRKSTSIEREAVIGSRCEIKTSVVEPKSYVGSYTYLADTVVGEEASIGPYVVSLNILPSGVKVSRLEPVEVLLPSGKRVRVSKLGAIIGDKAYVGAGNVLPAGTVIAANERLPPAVMRR